MRVLVNNGARARFAFFEGSRRVDPEAAVTVEVTRENGETLPNLTASLAEDEAFSGYVEVVLDGQYTERLDKLSLTWSTAIDGLQRRETTVAEIVGARYFDLHQLRDMEGLTSHNNYSDADLEFARLVAEARIENFCRTAFVPKYSREIFDLREFWSAPYACIFVRHEPARKLVSATMRGEIQDLSDWVITATGQIRAGEITLPTTSTFMNYRQGQDFIVEYEHGDDRPSEDLQRASLRYARHLALTELSSLPERTKLLQTDMGIAVLETAGKDRPTGMPDVDELLVELRKTAAVGFA